MIDKMIANTNVGGKSAAASMEALNLLLKRPWDPVLSVYSQQKPVILFISNLYPQSDFHIYSSF